MAVDAVLGRYGDLLFNSALAVYLLAMILHAVEHGLLRRTATVAAVSCRRRSAAESMIT